MNSFIVYCDTCGKMLRRTPSTAYTHNFCCREHLNLWNKRRIAEYNRTLNPLNQPGKTLEHRIRQSEKLRNRGRGCTYRKLLGRHEHRTMAEIMLGRTLKPYEVVHHVDRDKRNNNPDNLLVVDIATHARLHHEDMREGQRAH